MKPNDSPRPRKRRSPAPPPEDSTALVTVSKGATLQLEEFESYKINVSATLPLWFTERDVAQLRKAVRKANEVAQEELDIILKNDKML